MFLQKLLVPQFSLFSCFTSVDEQMHLGEDIVQSQTFQSLQVKDFWDKF